MKDVFTAKNPDQTQKIAARIAREISTNKRKKAVVISLIGDLGSGKTVFAKGFAKGLGVKECVVSPTFVLERIYKLKTKNYKLFIHIDAYRIEKSKEIADLGFKDLIRDCRNIVLIEWADRIKNILPKGCIIVKFEHINKNKRKITIKNF